MKHTEENLAEMMEEYEDYGYITCNCCGEHIELDGHCPEGTPSPFLVMGLI